MYEKPDGCPKAEALRSARTLAAQSAPVSATVREAQRPDFGEYAGIRRVTGNRTGALFNVVPDIPPVAKKHAGFLVVVPACLVPESNPCSMIKKPQPRAACRECR